MTKPRRHPNVVNLSEVETTTIEKGTRFAFAAKRLGAATASRGIGCNWFEVPPGRTAFPHHFHCANEESLFVLEGKGTLRLGEETLEVGPGDYVTFLVGPQHPHQLLNSSDTPLRYLCFSTLLPAEVVGYPDSNKIGAAMWNPDTRAAVLRHLFPRGAEVDYYEGEETG